MNHAALASFSSTEASSASTVPTSVYSYAPVEAGIVSHAGIDFSALPAGNVSLPLSLPRPESIHEVDPASLAFDTDLSEVPSTYVAAKLRAAGDELLAATAHARIQVPPEAQSGLTPLPSHLLVECDTDGIPPTHVLAVHGRDTADTLLLPAHGMIYALSCTTLGHLARTRPAIDDARLLPVTHIHLPSASAFPLLHAWLTARSSSALLSRLLPTDALMSDANGSAKAGMMLKPAVLASKLATRASLDELTRHVHLVHAFWANMVALGIADDELWHVCQLAWAVLVGALTIRRPS